MERAISELNHVLASTPSLGVLWLRYRDQKSVCRALIRMQEYYESPDPAIRRTKGLTVRDVEASFDRQFPGKCYYDEWHGFNIPGDVVRDFAEDYVSERTQQERDILRAVGAAFQPGERFYLIATHRDGDFTHELCHALWYLDPLYRNEAKNLLRCFTGLMPSLDAKMRTTLHDIGYASAVHDDEMNAYITTSDKAYLMRDDRFALSDQQATTILMVAEEFERLFMTTRNARATSADTPASERSALR